MSSNPTQTEPPAVENTGQRTSRPKPLPAKNSSAFATSAIAPNRPQSEANKPLRQKRPGPLTQGAWVWLTSLYCTRPP